MTVAALAEFVAKSLLGSAPHWTAADEDLEVLGTVVTIITRCRGDGGGCPHPDHRDGEPLGQNGAHATPLVLSQEPRLFVPLLRAAGDVCTARAAKATAVHGAAGILARQRNGH